LKDELQVLREELSTKTKTIADLKAELKEQKAAQNMAQQRLAIDSGARLHQHKDLAVEEVLKNEQGDEFGVDGAEACSVMSTSLGRLLLLSNLVLALTLLLVLRSSGSSLMHVKRGEYRE
jgi:hypothetical protein